MTEQMLQRIYKSAIDAPNHAKLLTPIVYHIRKLAFSVEFHVHGIVNDHVLVMALLRRL